MNYNFVHGGIHKNKDAVHKITNGNRRKRHYRLFTDSRGTPIQESAVAFLFLTQFSIHGKLRAEKIFK